uniref:Uncharacterized protein n=1 Tax=Rhizophagus irregularis (strain DAOM 181602 / DAOM 197198 / MUCL 43194) TaxID=747089 RepID=U9TYF1_RHIID
MSSPTIRKELQLFGNPIDNISLDLGLVQDVFLISSGWLRCVSPKSISPKPISLMPFRRRDISSNGVSLNKHFTESFSQIAHFVEGHLAKNVSD